MKLTIEEAIEHGRVIGAPYRAVVRDDAGAVVYASHYRAYANDALHCLIYDLLQEIETGAVRIEENKRMRAVLSDIRALEHSDVNVLLAGLGWDL